jgi:Oxidoreductase family, NAD-binding Rossmann fold
MKVLIVGMGQMGTIYVNNLLKMGFPASDIIMHDIDPAKVERAREMFPDIAIELDLAAVPVVETAIIASNSPSHARVIQELCQRGTKYFFCEKPLGMSVEEADDIGQAVDAVGGQVYTAFLINFSPAVESALSLMYDEAVLIEGQVIWGKNRFGDTRPSAGDTEDESVHAAELLRMLASVNRTIESQSVAGRLSYLDFVDQDAQNRAHELDPSFPLRVDSSTFATLAMTTDTGPVYCSLQSSFLLGEQVRTVRMLLAGALNPRLPIIALRFDFDVKRNGETVDILQVTDIREKKNLGEQFFVANKIRDQLDAFFTAVDSDGMDVDSRLTPWSRARSAVAFTKAIQASHETGGMPVVID